MARPPRIPNWLPWEQDTVYFITFCVERRKSVLANPRAWDICLTVLKRLDQWTTLAVIAMPDHVHLLTAPLDREASVSAFSKWFKRWFDEEYCRPFVSDGTAGNQTWQWQDGCFDRLLRSDESLSDKWEYLRQILSAPVWSAILRIGHTNSRRLVRNCNCRASVSDASQ
jgi:REP element-mobilizing transposase RayT